MMIIAIGILTMINFGLCVFIMYYYCRLEASLSAKFAIIHEDQSKFRADINKCLGELQLETVKKTSVTVHDPTGNSQKITLDELAEYVLNNEPIVRKADKIIWGKDESKSNI